MAFLRETFYIKRGME